MVDLSVVIPARDESENLKDLLPCLHDVLSRLGCSYEVIVIDGHSSDNTIQLSHACGARSIQQSRPGYGGALESGFLSAQGQYIVTLDADQSHDPSVIETLWGERNEADVVIASRYSRGGLSETPWCRSLLSRMLNLVLRTLLDIDVTDLSSGYRLYRGAVVRSMRIDRTDFAALTEIVVKAYAAGWRVIEVPFRYRQSGHSRSRTRVLAFGAGFLLTAFEMWKLRNSIACADYDARAFNSRIWFQRSWQRRRCGTIERMADQSHRILDVGCGSSQLLGMLAGRVTGLDVQINKLRYARRYQVPLTQGSGFSLPFQSAAFDCVICSQVIEHLPAGDGPLEELLRVLNPGGTLILGTPDYGTLTWPLIERAYAIAAPGAYADEHITHYTRTGLTLWLETHGMAVEAVRYVFGSEMILLATKKASLQSRELVQ